MYVAVVIFDLKFNVKIQLNIDFSKLHSIPLSA